MNHQSYLLPSLPRKKIEKGDPEIWQPHWECHCCHDSGYVMPKLIDLIIEGHNSMSDPAIVCQRCEKASWITEKNISLSNESFDWRLTPDICQQLHQIEKENWEQYAKDKWENKKQQRATQINKAINSIGGKF